MFSHTPDLGPATALVRVSLGSLLRWVGQVQFRSQPGRLFFLPPTAPGPQKHATGCKKHEQSSDKAKKPKVKKEKKKKKAPH